MTASKEERLRKVASLIDPEAWDALEPGEPRLIVERGHQRRNLAVSRAEAIDLLYAEEIGRLRRALGEIDKHRLRIKLCVADSTPEWLGDISDALDTARQALSQGLGGGGDGASNAKTEAAG